MRIEINESLTVMQSINFSKLFQAYAENCADETINEIGHNARTGYSFIELNNGIMLVCNKSRSVEYSIVDSTPGLFMFDTYAEALESLNDDDDDDDGMYLFRDADDDTWGHSK